MRDMESDYGSLKELAYRENDGIEIALLWNEHDDRLSVSVRDARTGELFGSRQRETRPSTSSTTHIPTHVPALFSTRTRVRPDVRLASRHSCPARGASPDGPTLALSQEAPRAGRGGIVCERTAAAGLSYAAHRDGQKMNAHLQSGPLPARVSQVDRRRRG